MGNQHESRHWLDHHLSHHASDLKPNGCGLTVLRRPCLMRCNRCVGSNFCSSQLMAWTSACVLVCWRTLVSLIACLRRGRCAMRHSSCASVTSWRIAFGSAMNGRPRALLLRRRRARTAAYPGQPCGGDDDALAAGLVAHIAECRAQLRVALGDLRDRWHAWDVANLRLQDLAWSNFYLAYHGEDDLPLQREYAQLLQDMAARVWPPWQQAPRCSHPRKVVMLSSFWRRCTVGVYFAGWIDWLRKA